MKKITVAIVILGMILILSVWLLFQKKEKPDQPSVVQEQKKTIYKLSFGHDMPEDSAQHLAALKFAEIVHHKSNGRVKIKVFPAQQLGTDHQMIEAARAGELAIILSPTAKLSTLVPAIQYPDLPFLFPNREDAYKILDGEPGEMLLEKLKSHGLIGVTFWESGFKQFTANKLIRKPEDFMGLKIRAMKSRIIMDQFNALGATPIPIDFFETYKALKDGVVDGQENPLVSIVNMKFYEVQSHVTISNHAYLGYVFAFSKKIFESLPADIQKILISTAKELTLFERKETIEREKAFIQTIKNSGTNVYSLSDKERALFRKATEHIIDKYRAIIGTEVLDKTFQILIAKYGIPEEDEIIIGLDADMTLGSAPSGLSIKRGVELAVSEINQNGGVLGKKIRIMVRDHGGISARGIANMHYFAGMKNLVAVMGGLHSPVALSELEIIHKEEIIYLDPWAAATSIVDNGYKPNYVFRVSVRDEFAGSFLVKQALKKYRKVALLLENTGWGRSNHKAMTTALAHEKLGPAAVEWFNWGEEDMTSQLTRIENSGAEVILLVANAPEGINIIKSMAMRPKKIPIISHWGITGGYFWENVSKELGSINLRFLQTFSFICHKREKTEEIIRNYMGKYNVNSKEEITAPVGTAHAYDLVHLLAKAIKRARSLERPLIRDALEQIGSHEGLVKTYSPPFTQNRHDALDQSDFLMAKYNNQGHIIPVENIFQSR
jgi:C4-dicarboxylate-binding protein DctP